MIIYEISTSITEPLKKSATIINTEKIFKMIKVGHELVLGEKDGYLEVFDIKMFKITHT